MSILLLFIFATVGFTHIMVYGKILDLIGVRQFLKKHLNEDWYGLFECCACMGFWCGMIIGGTLISVNPLVFIPCGFAGSVVSQFYDNLTYLMNSVIGFEIEDEKDK